MAATHALNDDHEVAHPCRSLSGSASPTIPVLSEGIMVGCESKATVPASTTMLFLTRDEGAELLDPLADLLDNFEEPGWHGHVASADYQTEITVAAGADLP